MNINLPYFVKEMPTRQQIPKQFLRPMLKHIIFLCAYIARTVLIAKNYFNI